MRAVEAPLSSRPQYAKNQHNNQLIKNWSWVFFAQKLIGTTIIALSLGDLGRTYINIRIPVCRQKIIKIYHIRTEKARSVETTNDQMFARERIIFVSGYPEMRNVGLSLTRKGGRQVKQKMLVSVGLTSVGSESYRDGPGYLSQVLRDSNNLKNLVQK